MTPMTIDSFKASLSKRGGLAKTNYFAVHIPIPLIRLNAGNIANNVLAGNTNPLQIFNDPRDVTFLCESTTLPGRVITTADYKTVSKSVKLPYDYMNDDVTMSFHLTQDYYMKEYFDHWMGKILDTANYRLRYKGDYCSDIVIQQLSLNNIPIYSVKLKNAYPTTVNSIELSNASENSTQKVSVTFAYDDYEVLDLTTSLMASAPSIAASALSKYL